MVEHLKDLGPAYMPKHQTLFNVNCQKYNCLNFQENLLNGKVSGTNSR